MIEPAPLTRWEELLADRTAGCLPHEERAELSTLLAEHPEVDPLEFDEAAAALQLALTPLSDEPVPVSVKRRLQASADAWFAGRPAVNVEREAPESRGLLLRSPWTGWIAAAALALVAAGPWLTRSAVKPTLAPPGAERVAMLAREDSGLWNFSTTEDPLAEGASGDVVWSTSEQRGFMRFDGLRPNDPTKEQYQLWIFDGTRTSPDPEETLPPIDGGVFDVPANGEIIVPIDAKLRVGEPALFAITLEASGGVVVSKQEHLLLIASTQS